MTLHTYVVPLCGYQTNHMKSKDKDQNLPPDEIERKKLKRERNKIAAAKCRQRRLDRINYLTQKTENLKNTGLRMEQEIKELEEIELKYQNILNSHKCIFDNSLQMQFNKNDKINGNITSTCVQNGYEVSDATSISSPNISYTCIVKISRPQTLDIKNFDQRSNLQNSVDNLENFNETSDLLFKEEFKFQNIPNFDTPMLKTPLFNFQDINNGDNKCLDFENGLRTNNSDLNTPVVFSFDSYPTSSIVSLTNQSTVQPLLEYENLINDDKSNNNNNLLSL